MIKDLVNGGVVGMGKNIGPRMKNIAKGDSFLNHAQFTDKPKSNLNKEQNNDTHNT